MGASGRRSCAEVPPIANIANSANSANIGNALELITGNQAIVAPTISNVGNLGNVGNGLAPHQLSIRSIAPIVIPVDEIVQRVEL